jgi:hypothetical protein
MFDEIRALYEVRGTVTEMAQRLGLGRRRIYRWVRRIELPEPNALAPKRVTRRLTSEFSLREVWLNGQPMSGACFLISAIAAIPARMAIWHVSSLPGAATHPRRTPAGEQPSLDQEAPARPRVKKLEPMTGRQISPLTAAALCVPWPHD